MKPNFAELFFFSFLIIAAIYAFLASWTPIFYKKRSVGQLRGDELLVKQGTARLDNRLSLFFRTFFSSAFTYQIYLLALLLSGSVYLLRTL